MDELTLARRQADEYAREADALRADIARLTARVLELEDEPADLESLGELSDQTDAELEQLRAAGDKLATAARSLAYAWETSTPDRVMWDEWAKVGPALKAWTAAR